tara:strand:+ start:307 stop:1692 length:1386 start_codon:yes stop_codon:yes gene_type:complete
MDGPDGGKAQDGIMTTINLTGVRVSFQDFDTVDARQGLAQIIVGSENDTFSYSIVGYDDGVPVAEISDTVVQAVFDGVSDYYAPENMVAYMAEVNWGANNISTVLGVRWETGPNTDTEYYFVLDGADFPTIDTASDWDDFDLLINSISAPTGPYAPGQQIAWTDFNSATTTEDDEFYGTPERDIFAGGIGDDYFISSAGNDVYRGQAGIDQVTFLGDPTGVYANLNTGRATDGWGNRDKLFSIEMLRGSMHDDRFVGSDGNDIMRGLAGNDFMNAGNGRQDTVRYDRDTRFGGNDGVTVRLDREFAIDGFGDRDILKGFENAMGSDFNDRIYGDNGNNRLIGLDGADKLFGLNGQDTLEGAAGRDVLDGGNGDDLLIGGAQFDKFVFSGRFGNDTIADFQTAGQGERIDLSGVNRIKSFRDLKNNHLSEVDGDAVISDNNGNTITLDGVAMDDLRVNDFLF